MNAYALSINRVCDAMIEVYPKELLSK